MWLMQIPAVYIELLQWFVVISLFNSEPPRLVSHTQTSPTSRSLERWPKVRVKTLAGDIKKVN